MEVICVNMFVPACFDVSCVIVRGSACGFDVSFEAMIAKNYSIVLTALVLMVPEGGKK